MALLILGIIVGSSSLFICERLSVRGVINAELARKIPHLISGCIVATWPLYVSRDAIIMLALVYCLLTLVTNKLKVFRTLRLVNRKSWGEWFYPAGVIAVALLNPTKWIFTVALLHFGIADALAAIVGKRYGTQRTTYRVFGHTKTIVGSAAFYLTSLLLVSLLLFFDHSLASSRLMIVSLVPVVSTFLENIGVFGADNMFVPFGVALLLIHL
jgi:phytol kinase